MMGTIRVGSLSGLLCSVFFCASPVDAYAQRHGIPSLDEAERLKYLPTEVEQASYYRAYKVLMNPGSWSIPENRRILEENLAAIEAFERRETYLSQLYAKKGNLYGLAFEDIEDNAAYLRAAIDVIKSNYDEQKLFELIALKGRYYFSIGEYEKALDLSFTALSDVPQESFNEDSYAYVSALAVSGWSAFYLDHPDSWPHTLGIARDSFKVMSDFKNPYLKELASYGLRAVYGPWFVDGEPAGFIYDLRKMYKNRGKSDLSPPAPTKP